MKGYGSLVVCCGVLFWRKPTIRIVHAGMMVRASGLHGSVFVSQCRCHIFCKEDDQWIQHQWSTVHKSEGPLAVFQVLMFEPARLPG
jgi:hypothetical protein